MTTVIKFLISVILVLNQMSAAEARAQGSAVGLSEVAKTVARAATFGDWMKSIKNDVDDKMFAYVEKKTARIAGAKPPQVILKSEDELEISHRGVILIVKIPNPYKGVVLLNNREIDLQTMNDPEKFYESVRKALPRKTAQVLFELFFGVAEAAERDVTPTRVVPGATGVNPPAGGFTAPAGAATGSGINAPAGATQIQPGINRPGYSASGAAPAAPVLNAMAQPKPASSGGGMGMMLPLLAAGLMIMMMLKGGGSECGNVDKRSEKCEQLRTKMNAGENVSGDAQTLASETRSDSGNNACSGARQKMKDCMTLLKAGTQSRFGFNIGDTEPPTAPATTLPGVR